MKSNLLYKQICEAQKNNKKLLAILIDPDKVQVSEITFLIQKIKQSPATHIFVGGSIVTNFIIDELVLALKAELNLPIILFPGDPSQISEHADAILFLNLISGRNPDYLIDIQVKSVPLLKNSKLEIIPTGYLLIDGGKETAVQRVSKTTPISNTAVDQIVNTAIAGMWMGNQLIYLEAGSGALQAISPQIIKQVKQELHIPLLVGGGIKTYKQIETAYQNGADLVVIGTAFENNPHFFDNSLC
ncbi:geranylgeranylglyceryl/heptaprenylglyceryl phosphate synthase [Flavobacterium agricola]|uniref:Geranylgeranylglyceryl phosphate synthase n=1 Tax=Flavobacterium agricola TaxID=2870839 RepID=A0ABY6LZI1_9FLAO|nr:geranylgeranylglyceryl/heptaprenylglyceryl phosphate synthase [Flavobacterium agricola]UYW00819.1 geranylgeranylglyceryl/heptaprenylglyceryl phosphate synthase [Flavobacterium agricola]